MIGKIVSTKMNNTVIVEVERWVVHPIYKKRMKRNRRFAAHNELPLEVGAIVEIVETKPISKTKSFIVKTVVEQASGVAKK